MEMRRMRDNRWHLRVIMDQRKGWLVVPLIAIYERQLEGAISFHSYMDAGKGQAYLEEDADAPLFLAEVQKEGIVPVLHDVPMGKSCFIRRLPRFRPPPTSF